MSEKEVLSEIDADEEITFNSFEEFVDNVEGTQAK